LDVLFSFFTISASSIEYWVVVYYWI
jgi:hypothetical protein